MTRTLAPFFALLLLAGCEGYGAYQCNDGVDNDNDGWTDGSDTACDSEWWNNEASGEDTECSDRVDNDGDGLIDADDPNCVDGWHDDESAPGDDDDSASDDDDSASDDDDSAGDDDDSADDDDDSARRGP